MRCPRCAAEYEPQVTTCAECGVPLVSADTTTSPEPATPDATLGTFHPFLAVRLAATLEERGIRHHLEPSESGDRLVVDRAWRDDLLAEFTLTWGEIVRRLPEEQVAAVLATGGTSPGWYDAPRGGHVDRQGRLVVVAEEDERADDAARLLGPALLTLGAILVVVGWYAMDSAAVALAGVALAVFGLLSPR